MTVNGDRRLDRDLARHLATRSFSCTSEQDRVGLELEWLVFDRTDPARRLRPEDVVAVVERDGPLPGGVTCSPEPGGQIELDTPPMRLGVSAALARSGATVLRRRLADAGLLAVAVGVDPHRRPENLLDVPRYRAMQATFSARGPDGVAMMGNTAAMQVNIDLDPGGERWRLVHQLGPLLVAAFANSPVGIDGVRSHRCQRLAIWSRMDPTRTAPVPHDGDPARAWLEYALSANVLLIRRAGEAHPVEQDLSFEQWLADGHPLGPPTADDFAYHLSTLFPPVRPRGYLELRFLDALDAPDWHVAAVVIAVATSAPCRQAALALSEAATDRWSAAIECGLADPALAAMADELADLCVEHLERVGPASTAELLATWRDGDLADRRCPGDTVLDRWVRTGTVLPEVATA